jgi:predicted extracellular nuclease
MSDRGGAGTIRGGSGGGGAGGRAAGGAPSGAAGGSKAGGGAGGAAAGRSGSAGTGQGGAPTHAFFFSEYVEGSSSYKALEITARESSTFAGCRLVTYFNGSSSGSGILLDGVLPGGSAYVLCSTALATLVGSACHRATNLTFNGDDALALECDGTLLDVIGQIGVDPGDAWGSGDASTLNQTLRRNCSSSSGDRDGSNSFDPTSEWSAFPMDTFDGLGQAECTDG